MNCTKHPDQEASGICVHCGNFFAMIVLWRWTEKTIVEPAYPNYLLK